MVPKNAALDFLEPSLCWRFSEGGGLERQEWGFLRAKLQVPVQRFPITAIITLKFT